MEFKINDIVTLKKPHPCENKSNSFYLLSLDGEVRLKCCGCGNIILLKRNAFEKSLKVQKKSSTN